MGYMFASGQMEKGFDINITFDHSTLPHGILWYW